MREFVQRRPLAVFAALLMIYGFGFFVLLPFAFGLDAPIVEGRQLREFGYIALPLGLIRIPDNPVLIMFFGYGASPSLAGLTVAAMGWGRQGVTEIFGRLRPWRHGIDVRKAVSAYVKIVFLFLLLCLMWIAAHLMINGVDGPSPFAGVKLTALLAAILVGLTLNPGGVLEEVAGYRGFLLPHLLNSGVSPIKAAILIAVLWIIWHHAVPFSPLLVSRDELAASPQFWTRQLPIFTSYMIIGNVAISIIMTHFYLKTGSTLPAIMIHSGINSVPFGLPLSSGSDSFASVPSQTLTFALMIAYALCAAAVLLTGGLRMEKVS
ncbi:CPBP family intramembrane glutamic endopeptidase [Aquisediminimonas profunda]|uniref:CPBP family intramembrane glutamic endopeptidase n=1 Tax=Aquisediminimonas profunda TaxID=1550733 RepID=UPI001C625720|nr:CPBP family intramembrane glutamic endopeptidase [Aquisediminimonas profunda]